MRYLLIGITFLTTTISCRKPPSPHEPRLVLSKTTMARGEIVTATVTDLPAGTILNWQFPGDCFPNSQPDSSKVSLFHSDPGEYQLKVKQIKFFIEWVMDGEGWLLAEYPFTNTVKGVRRPVTISLTVRWRLFKTFVNKKPN